MLRSTLLVAAAGVIALVSLTSDASARSARFKIFDDKGKVLFDDKKLDGKGCVVGKVAVFNPKTGKLKTIPKAKCNF